MENTWQRALHVNFSSEILWSDKVPIISPPTEWMGFQTTTSDRPWLWLLLSPVLSSWDPFGKWILQDKLSSYQNGLLLISLMHIQQLTELMRRVTPNQKDKGIIRCPNASGEPDFSFISRQYPLPPPIPRSSEASSLPSQIASQSTAMIESSNSMTHTPAHKWSQCVSAQNQTALVKSAQAQADSTAE